MMRRRLLPRPRECPPGFMLWHQRMVPVDRVEEIANRIMRGFDALPPPIRFALNAAPEWPHKAGVYIGRYGAARAATVIINDHWANVFKTPDGEGVHP